MPSNPDPITRSMIRRELRTGRLTRLQIALRHKVKLSVVAEEAKAAEKAGA